MDDPRIQVIGEAASPEAIEIEQRDVDVTIWSPSSTLYQDAPPLELGKIVTNETAGLLLIHDDPTLAAPLARQKTHGWGLLAPEASKEEIISAVNAIHEGLMVTNPLWVEQLSSANPPGSVESNDMVEPLTTRELEILQLLAQGLTNKQIALKLGISSHTVKFHVSSIFGKLGTNNRTETVKLGLQKGLILL